MIARQPRLWSGCAGRARLGVALAAASLVLGCRAVEVRTCPQGAPIEVDLTAWAQALEGTAPNPHDYGRLLGELGLEPLPHGADRSSEDRAMALALVEARPVRRGGHETPDQLVAARFSSPAGVESLRTQLLRPVPGRENLYCPLGDQLSHDQGIHEKPCLERHAGPARALAVEPLVAPDRDAVIVRDAGGWCGPGADRGDRLTVSYWGVERDRLVRYLEAVTFEAWYRSPSPPARIRRGALTLSNGWPRIITLTETVECLRPDEPGSTAADCESFASRTEYRYADRAYTVSEELAPTAGPTAVGTEEDTP